MAVIGAIVLALMGMAALDAVTLNVAKATVFLEERGYNVIASTFTGDVAAIKAKTDNLPASPANEATSLLIKARTDLIPAVGIASDSTLNLVYSNTTAIRAKTDLIVSGGATEALLEDVETEAKYIEDHLHHKTVWYGKNADQTTYWANSTSLVSFRATSGDNTYGTEGTDPAKCFSALDTLPELGVGLTYGDFDQVLFTSNSSSTLYKLRLIWGTGTVAEAVAAGQYSETVFLRDTADKSRQPRLWSTPKIGIDNQLWVECWNASNDATIDFVIGVHAYNF
jgi:hypothetical protein